MIILDTNVVSEMMKPAPSRAVLDWLNAQDAASLHVTTITLAEIGYGLRLLPDGQRHRLLVERFDRFIAQAFDQRILSFDEAAARAYGDVMGHRKELGRPISVTDGQIAAIARSKGFGIATRNIKDFDDSQIALINPFSVGTFPEITLKFTGQLVLIRAKKLHIVPKLGFSPPTPPFSLC